MLTAAGGTHRCPCIQTPLKPVHSLRGLRPRHPSPSEATKQARAAALAAQYTVAAAPTLEAVAGTVRPLPSGLPCLSLPLTS